MHRRDGVHACINENAVHFESEFAHVEVKPKPIHVSQIGRIFVGLPLWTLCCYYYIILLFFLLKPSQHIGYHSRDFFFSFFSNNN